MGDIHVPCLSIFDVHIFSWRVLVKVDSLFDFKTQIMALSMPEAGVVITSRVSWVIQTYNC